MSKCDEIRERLAEEGAEAAESVVEIKRHLDGCADCTRFRDEQARVDAALADLPAQDAPDELVAETLRAVRAAAEAKKPPPRPFTVQRYVGLGLAASVVIAAGLGLTLSREWLDSQRVMVAEKPADPNVDLSVVDLPNVDAGEADLSDRDGAKDQLARGAQAPEPENPEPESPEPESPEPEGPALRENEPAPVESYATVTAGTAVGSGSDIASETESFETAELAQKKAEQTAQEGEAEEDLYLHAGAPRNVEGATSELPTASRSELDVIAQLEAQGRYREDARPSAAGLRKDAPEKEASEVDYLLSAIREQSASRAPGDKAAKTKQDSGADDAPDNEADNEAARLQSSGYYADAQSAGATLSTGTLPAEPGLSGTGEAVGGLHSDPSSSIVSADEEVTANRPDPAEAVREARRRSLLAHVDSLTPQRLAAAFLNDHQRIEGLAFQEASGYWANSYIPGDPAMRLLRARLEAWDRGALGQSVRLEERVQPVPQPFDAPEDAALAVYLHADAPAIEGPTRLRLQVGIKGAERQGGHRPAMNIGLLIDLRNGADAEAARRIRALIAALERARQPEDRFSLTVAGPGGGLLVAPGEFRHGPLRVAMERLFADPKQAPAIYHDLPNALAEASKSVRAGDDPGAVLGSSLVLLVTGSSLADDLAALERMAHLNAVAGVPLSVVGLAAQEDLAQIDRLVAAGQGNRRILDRAQAADGLIDQELHASSRAVARALRLRIRLAPGVKLVDVLGSRRLDEELAERVREAEVAIDRRLARNLGIEADRGEDEEGIQIVIPNFTAGDSHTILLDVVAERPGPLADVTLRYKDVVYLRNGVARANLTVEDAPRSAGPLELNVLKNLVAWESAKRIRQAAAFLRDGDSPELAAVPLTMLRGLIQGLRNEVPGWQSDPDLLADEATLGEYLAVFATPAADEPVQRRYLADSLHYAAFRKLQTAARP